MARPAVDEDLDRSDDEERYDTDPISRQWISRQLEVMHYATSKCLDAVLALTKKIESFSNWLETVENDLAALKLSNQETGQDTRKLREQFSMVEQQIEKLDRENRATNIIIEGLNLDKGNDEVLESVQKLLENTLEVRVRPVEVTRLGTTQKTRISKSTGNGATVMKRLVRVHLQSTTDKKSGAEVFARS